MQNILKNNLRKCNLKIKNLYLSLLVEVEIYNFPRFFRLLNFILKTKTLKEIN